MKEKCKGDESVEKEVMIRVIDGKPCVSTSFLAFAFGVSKQTIATWGRKGCPKIQQGYWYLPDVIEWKEGGIKDKQDVDVSNLSLEKQKIHWEKELKRAQTENRRFQNAIDRKEYIKTEEATKELASFFSTFKQSALGIPSKLGVIAATYLENKAEARILEKEAMEIIEDGFRQWSNSTFWEEITRMDNASIVGTQTARETDS